MRLRCIREHMGLEIGDLAEYKNDGAEYVPGWDAGNYTVWPDKFPEKSPYGHRGVSYWTRNEMMESWEEA